MKDFAGSQLEIEELAQQLIYKLVCVGEPIGHRNRHLGHALFEFIANRPKVYNALLNRATSTQAGGLGPGSPSPEERNT